MVHSTREEQLREKVESLEDIRNKLLTDSRLEPENVKPGYVNAVLDFYNRARDREDRLIKNGRLK